MSFFHMHHFISFSENSLVFMYDFLQSSSFTNLCLIKSGNRYSYLRTRIPRRNNIFINSFLNHPSYFNPFFSLSLLEFNDSMDIVRRLPPPPLSKLSSSSLDFFFVFLNTQRDPFYRHCTLYGSLKKIRIATHTLLEGMDDKNLMPCVFWGSGFLLGLPRTFE
ncbi:hypothetical protein, no similarity [Maudiozyma saulgeensis]|uniref:Uncharacterized protein n=1 Tax=Maudiozyma saulgeensis TaxID=1789683 RepID=A0A1X7R323_9SACH|nr:hypothetical protein, no similarity [Kazachstania saulgeensis]